MGLSITDLVREARGGEITLCGKRMPVRPLSISEGQRIREAFAFLPEPTPDPGTSAQARADYRQKVDAHNMNQEERRSAAYVAIAAELTDADGKGAADCPDEAAWRRWIKALVEDLITRVSAPEITKACDDIGRLCVEGDATALGKDSSSATE